MYFLFITLYYVYDLIIDNNCTANAELILGFAFTSASIYRTTLCVSAVFAVGRCPSVRPSRPCIASRRLNVSSNFFIDPVAPSF